MQRSPSGDCIRALGVSLAAFGEHQQKKAKYIVRLEHGRIVDDLLFAKAFRMAPCERGDGWRHSCLRFFHELPIPNSDSRNRQPRSSEDQLESWRVLRDEAGTELKW